MTLSALPLLVLSTSAAASPGDSAAVIRSTNSTRATAHLSALRSCPDLAAVATAWAQQMAARRDLLHNPAITRQVRGWSLLGENVGTGPTWSRVQTAFLDSATHRRHLLSASYLEIGVGTARDTDGRVWVDQVFRRPQRGTCGTTAHAGSAAAPAVARRPARPARASRGGRGRAAQVTVALRRLEQRRPGADPVAAQLDYVDATAALDRARRPQPERSAHQR